MRCSNRPDTFNLSKMKTGLLHILQGSDLFPGSIIIDLEDLLGVLEPLEQLEPVMYLKGKKEKRETVALLRSNTFL